MREFKEKKNNCTTIFLVPGTGLRKKDIVKHGFLSAYLDDRNHEIHHESSVYLLFHPEDITAFQQFLEKEYKRTPLLVEDYDYEGGYIVTVYKFPEKFMEEYNLFLEGKYSKFRKVYVELFPKEVLVTDSKGNKSMEISLTYHIFTRSEAIKRYWEEKIGQDIPDEMELWSSPDLEKETLDINNIYKNDQNG